MAALFERAGRAVVDTDTIAQQLTAPGGSALAAIARCVIGILEKLERVALRVLLAHQLLRRGAAGLSVEAPEAGGVRVRITF